jgi:hypothetical protein
LYHYKIFSNIINGKAQAKATTNPKSESSCQYKHRDKTKKEIQTKTEAG